MITVNRYAIHRVLADGRSLSDAAIHPGSEDLGEAKDMTAGITRSDRGQAYALVDNGDKGTIIGQYVAAHALPFKVQIRFCNDPDMSMLKKSQLAWSDTKDTFDTLEDAITYAKDLDRLRMVIAWRVLDNAGATHHMEGTFNG